MEDKFKKILFADLDGTLIDTISGNTFPKGIWDMRFRFDVLDKIREQRFKRLIIVTNQGGIEKGFVEEKDFETKIKYVSTAISEYIGIPVHFQYCRTNKVDDENRKPNVGMLKNAVHKYLIKHFLFFKKSEMLMIGDASGKDGQFSDSDRRTAENFEIDYLDVEDFVKGE